MSTGSDEGASGRAVPEAAPHSPLWCRARLHHDWVRRTTPDGGRYRHCRACGIDDDGTVNQSFDGWMGSNVPPTNER